MGYGKNDTVDVADIRADFSYQRHYGSKPHLTGEFREDLFGRIILSKRKNGTYAVVDGQNRVNFAREKKIQRVPAIVHEGLTPVQEADLFWQINSKRKGVRAFEVFQAMLRAKNPEALQIYAIMQEFEIDYGNRPSETILNPGKFVFVLYRRRLLRRAFEFISAIWGKDPRRNTQQFLMGVSLFLTDCDKYKLSFAEVKRSLERVSIPRLLQFAMNYMARNRYEQVRKALTDVWNKGRRSQRIEAVAKAS